MGMQKEFRPFVAPEILSIRIKESVAFNHAGLIVQKDHHGIPFDQNSGTVDQSVSIYGALYGITNADTVISISSHPRDYLYRSLSIENTSRYTTIDVQYFTPMTTYFEPLAYRNRVSSTFSASWMEGSKPSSNMLGSTLLLSKS